MSDIADKIRALLAKARGTDNPHEHAAFYAKAHELMAKFNIEENSLSDKHDLVFGSETWDGDEKWLWIVSNCAAKLIGVNIFKDCKYGSAFGGRPMNVDMAEELFRHYVDQINKYYKLALPKGLSKADRGVFRRNFKEGAAQVLWCRVCEIVAANTRALIVSPLQLDAEASTLSGGKAVPDPKAIVIKHNSVGTVAGRVAGHLIETGKEIRQ